MAVLLCAPSGPEVVVMNGTQFFRYRICDLRKLTVGQANLWRVPLVVLASSCSTDKR